MVVIPIILSIDIFFGDGGTVNDRGTMVVIPIILSIDIFFW